MTAQIELSHTRIFGEQLITGSQDGRPWDGLNPDLEVDAEGVARIRVLVDRLTIQRDGGIVVEGNLAGMLALALGKTKPSQEQLSVIKVVAGGRYHRYRQPVTWWPPDKNRLSPPLPL